MSNHNRAMLNHEFVGGRGVDVVSNQSIHCGAHFGLCQTSSRTLPQRMHTGKHLDVEDRRPTQPSSLTNEPRNRLREFQPLAQP